jgi:hypothetical protein
MSGLSIGRGFAAITLLAAFISPAAAERASDALVMPDPAETAAPADASFASACQASARERFGQERAMFARPSHTARDGTSIVRMDVMVAGEPFRAVCTRDRAGGAIETAVFAGPGDESGPRVIVLGGTPAPGPRPAAGSTGPYFILRDPSRGDGNIYYGGGYDSGYQPGLGWADTARDGSLSGRGRHDCRDCRIATVNGTRVIVREDGTVVAVTNNRRFVERVPGSSAPFATGGMASPGIGNFPPAMVRSGSIGVRSGGARTIGSFGR